MLNNKTENNLLDFKNHLKASGYGLWKNYSVKNISQIQIKLEHNLYARVKRGSSSGDYIINCMFVSIFCQSLGSILNIYRNILVGF